MARTPAHPKPEGRFCEWHRRFIGEKCFCANSGGTGKELVAFAIHKESWRRSKRFVAFNCGALPEGGVESEFFGHEKGAFTGAVIRKKGRFELAQKGTVFLDEVSEMPPTVQVKLLRVLQDGRFERIGGSKTIHVDIRVISATNKNLEREVEEGRFRRDLYHRLCVMPMKLSPLREWGEDIILLSNSFIEHYAEALPNPKPEIALEALSKLNSWHWSGNVRELQNGIQYALIKSHGRKIKKHHFPKNFQEEEVEANYLPGPRRRITKDEIVKELSKTNGDKQKAARFLGVSRSTIYRYFEN